MPTRGDSAVQTYLSLEDIPWYQRAWVWGSAALLILLCGLVTGWLVKPEVRLPDDPLTAQEAVNQHLREQITRLEALMNGDICSSDLKVVLPPAPQQP